MRAMWGEEGVTPWGVVQQLSFVRWQRCRCARSVRRSVAIAQPSAGALPQLAELSGCLFGGIQQGLRLLGARLRPRRLTAAPAVSAGKLLINQGLLDNSILT